MHLTEKEKNILTIMHEARMIDNKFVKEYESELKTHISFSYKEILETIRKLVAEGLLKEVNLKEKELMYFHTSKVSEKMINPKLREVGH